MWIEQHYVLALIELAVSHQLVHISLADTLLRVVNARCHPFSLGVDDKHCLRAIADQREATPSQVALAWVLAKGAFAIPGTKRLNYLEQNIAAASLHLSADDIARLNQAYAPGSFTGERYSAEGMKGVNV